MRSAEGIEIGLLDQSRSCRSSRGHGAAQERMRIVVAGASDFDRLAVDEHLAVANFGLAETDRCAIWSSTRPFRLEDDFQGVHHGCSASHCLGAATARTLASARCQRGLRAGTWPATARLAPGISQAQFDGGLREGSVGLIEDRQARREHRVAIGGIESGGHARRRLSRCTRKR